MQGLPKTKQLTRARPPQSYFLFGGIEKLTYDLLRGDEISAETVRDAQALIARVGAMRDALEQREAMRVQEPTDDI